MKLAKLISGLGVLFWFFALCGFPHAETPPHPMTPENDRLFAEGLKARDAQYQQDLEQLRGIPQWKRDELTQTLEGGLTDLAGARAVIVSLEVFPDNVYCGSAIYGVKDHGIFVIDSHKPDRSTLHATKGVFNAAGCNRQGVVFR